MPKLYPWPLHITPEKFFALDPVTQNEASRFALVYIDIQYQLALEDAEAAIRAAKSSSVILLPDLPGPSWRISSSPV